MGHENNWDEELDYSLTMHQCSLQDLIQGIRLKIIERYQKLDITFLAQFTKKI
jgi:hypothetical protein